jgi:tetratricopeptide (TPR) repeat protein|tara:strand:+ start:12898 stop:15126 length:2229 start_codon:yes stop_codon:yes gene_type:complete
MNEAQLERSMKAPETARELIERTRGQIRRFHLRDAEALLQSCRIATRPDAEQQEVSLLKRFIEFHRSGDPASVLLESAETARWAEALGYRLLRGRALSTHAECMALDAQIRGVAADVHVIGLLFDEAISCHGLTPEGFQTWLRKTRWLHLAVPESLVDARLELQNIGREAHVSSDAAAQADALALLSHLDFNDSPQSAIEGFESALEIALQGDDVTTAANVRLLQAQTLATSGLDSKSLLLEALGWYRESKNLKGEFQSLQTLGQQSHVRGDHDSQFRWGNEALAVANQTGSLFLIESATFACGDYAFRTGDYSRALASCESLVAGGLLPDIRAWACVYQAVIRNMLNQSDKAEELCLRALDIWRDRQPADGLSLTLMQLGESRAAQGNLTQAIDAWEQGIAIDEAAGNRVEMSMKLRRIATVLMVQHRPSDDSPIPEGSKIEQSFDCFDRALQAVSPPRNVAECEAAAGVMFSRGHAAFLAGNFEDAFQNLSEARSLYAVIERPVQIAFCDEMLGAVCYGFAKRGHPEFYETASQFLRLALDYFDGQSMCELTWRIRHILAQALLRGWTDDSAAASNVAIESEGSKHVQRLTEEAAADLNRLRSRFVGADSVEAQDARLSLVTDHEQVYVFGVETAWLMRSDAGEALRWTELLKSRTLLDAIGLRAVRAPGMVGTTILDREASLLEILNSPGTRSERITAADELEELWRELDVSGEADAYISLRRGTPVDWKEIRDELLSV